MTCRNYVYKKKKMNVLLIHFHCVNTVQTLSSSFSFQMDHFSILQKICDNITDSLNPGTAAYIYAAAIYDSWVVGTDIEKNIANRLVELWHTELVRKMNDAFSQEKRTWAHFGSRYALKQIPHDEFCRTWVDTRIKQFADNKGLRCALQKVIESNRDTPT